MIMQEKKGIKGENMKLCSKCSHKYDEKTYTKACPYCGTSNQDQSVLHRAALKQIRLR